MNKKNSDRRQRVFTPLFLSLDRLKKISCR